MAPLTDPQGWGREDVAALRRRGRAVARRLLCFPALYRGSGDHGSLLSRRRPGSKPCAPVLMCDLQSMTERGCPHKTRFIDLAGGGGTASSSGQAAPLAAALARSAWAAAMARLRVP